MTEYKVLDIVVSTADHMVFERILNDAAREGWHLMYAFHWIESGAPTIRVIFERQNCVWVNGQKIFNPIPSEGRLSGD